MYDIRLILRLYKVEWLSVTNLGNKIPVVILLRHEGYVFHILVCGGNPTSCLVIYLMILHDLRLIRCPFKVEWLSIRNLGNNITYKQV